MLKRILNSFLFLRCFMKKRVLIFFFLFVLLIFYLLIGDYFHIYLFCPIKKFLGLYCPGCGVTRMCLSILKGEFYQAFRYNPLVFLCLPFFLLYYLDFLYQSSRQKKSRLSFLEPGIWYFLIFLFFTYGILRNIPLFDFLQPTIV